MREDNQGQEIGNLERLNGEKSDEFRHPLDFQYVFSEFCHNLAENLITALPFSPAKVFAMKQIILALVAFSSIYNLPAQNVTYVLFNRDCMNQLEYRYSYPNVKGDNAVWAYSIKPNVQEHYIFMTEGAGHYSPELPAGAISCRNLNLDDAFVASVNREEEQMLIVFQRQSGGYWVMPVESATLVARSGSKYWVRSMQSSFQFDTLRLVNEQNLAVAGSPTAAYFSGAKLNNCQMEYSFHCEPVKTGRIRSDFQFIPGVGITNDRTGTSASQAMENELQLVRVNGKALDDFITDACPEGSGKIAISKFQKPAAYGDEGFEPDKEIASIMQKEQQDEKPSEYNAPSIQCRELWEPGTHIVQKGENLRAIARTYKLTEQNLIKWNKIQDPNKIEVCQKLWLKQPPVGGAAQTNKGIAAKGIESPALAGSRTVKKQEGNTVVPQKSAPAKKSYDPGSPVVYSNTPDDSDYEYFKSGDTDTRPRVHTVHRGEYLYKIAKMYGCPEECIRIANDMSLEGDEPLSIGQKLIIPACTCTVNGKAIKSPTPAPASTGSTVKKQTSDTESAADNTPAKKKRSSILDEDTPVVYNYDDNSTNEPQPKKETAKGNLYEESSLYPDDSNRANDNKTTGSGKKAKEDPNKVPLFKEHLVKQGENLKSIAAKYRVDASELSQVNGLDPKEALIPGKLILIPIEDN